MSNVTYATPPAVLTNDRGDGGGESFTGNNYFMVLWIVCLILFLCLPFCGTSYRRKLCLQRIKQRRWTVEDPRRLRLLEQQRQRRQQVEENQRRFQVSKTQEDEIRQQYVEATLEPYTMILEETDIHQVEENNLSHRRLSFFGKPSSSRSLGSAGSRSSRRKASAKDLTMTESMDDEEEHESSRHTQALTEDASPLDIPASGAEEDEEAVPPTETEPKTDDATTDLEGDIPVDIEAPLATGESESPARERTHSMDSDDYDENDLQNDGMELMEDPDENLLVPLAGTKRDQSGTRRTVPNGCAICLCGLSADESLAWSSNPACSHIFHTECLIHWFLTVGRKTARRRRRDHPNMSPEEALNSICQFPMLCPCCRQAFFEEKLTEPKEVSESASEADVDDSPPETNLDEVVPANPVDGQT